MIRKLDTSVLVRLSSSRLRAYPGTSLLFLVLAWDLGETGMVSFQVLARFVVHKVVVSFIPSESI